MFKAIHFVGFLLMILVKSALAQNGFRIEGKLHNATPMRLILAQHFGGELMPIDTAVVGQDGRFVWEDTHTIPAGMCRIIGIGRGLDIVVADSQRFSFEADIKDVIGTIRFQNSTENTQFFDYQRQVRVRYQKALIFRKQTNIKDDNDPRWKARFEELNEEIKYYVDSLYAKQPESFVIRFLKSYQEPKRPILPIKKWTAKDSLYLQSYIRAHYFENSFLSDERMIYTPTVPARITRFWKNIEKLPSSELIKTIENVIGQTQGTVELRKFVVGKVANDTEFASTTALDSLYSYIIEKYVTHEPSLWDASTLQKVKEIKQIKDRVSLNKTFPELILVDTLNRQIALNEINSDYTLLFFYDPGCSHCREQTPKLTKLAKQYPEKLKVFAVSLDAEEKTWKEFIKDFRTETFVNVRDASRKIEFDKLGVYHYPTLYLLDRQKKIVARWLSLSQLEIYLLN